MALIEAKGGKAATDNIATLKKGDMADRAPEPLTRPHSGTRAKRKLWLARCAPPPCHWRGTPLLGRRGFSFALPSLLHRSRDQHASGI